jgi:hypothetical protein
MVCKSMKTNPLILIYKHAPASQPLGIFLGGADLVILPDFTENMGFVLFSAAFRYVWLDFLKVDALKPTGLAFFAVLGLVEARRSSSRSEEPSCGVGSAFTSPMSTASRATREKSDQRMVDVNR